MRTRLLLCGLIAFVHAVPVFAAPSHIWSKRFGSTGADGGQSVAFDASGNVFISGTFTGTVDFGGGGLVSAGNNDAFLAKYDANGAHLWSKRFGGTAVDFGRNVIADASGNVYLSGFFTGTADFGGGGLMSAGSLDVFLAKFDANGAHVWSKRFGSTGADEGEGLALDSTGQPIITGYFNGTVNFGGDPLVSAGDQDVFIAKYDASGNHVWSKRVGGTAYDYSSAVVCDPTDHVVVIGYFYTSADFGGGPLASAGSADIFVAKYDSDGAHVWSKRFGGAGRDEGHAVDTDLIGRVLASGEFRLTVDFGGGNRVSAGNGDIFALQLGADGAHQWSKRFGDVANDAAYAIVNDGGNGVFLTGYFNFFVDFGGGEFVTTGNNDIFLAKFNDAGVHQWSNTFGSTQSESGSAMATGGSALLVTGDFSQTVNFGGSNLVSAGGSDIFLLKYNADAATPVARARIASTLGANYPNPFNPSTSIPFTLARAGHVSIKIYGVNGALVATLLNEHVEAGPHVVRWDGVDAHGWRAASGLYFVTMESGGSRQTSKAVLLK